MILLTGGITSMTRNSFRVDSNQSTVCRLDEIISRQNAFAEGKLLPVFRRV